VTTKEVLIATRNPIWVPVITRRHASTIGSLRRQPEIKRTKFRLACGALLLAFIGIYATLSLSVGQHSREFAIRIAVGADHPHITSLVMRNSLLIVVGAEVLGIAGALLLVKLLSTLLFSVKPTHPASLAIVALFSGATALAASYVTARRYRR
jgi:ABC-type antimicrobial peptide transport system permease subunit